MAPAARGFPEPPQGALLWGLTAPGGVGTAQAESGPRDWVLAFVHVT